MNTGLQSCEDPTLDQLSTLQLPTLPAGTPYLLKSLTNENIDFTELAGVIEKFPSIAGKLIALVNSAWSAPAAEVTSLEATCSRLGLGVVRSTSIALAVAAPFNPSQCPAFDLERYWCSVLLCADAASRLTAVSSPPPEFEPATARAAGLLHNLGLLWLVDQLPAGVDQALTLVEQQQAETVQQALTQVLVFDQAQAGEHLGNSWGLPQPLVCAMAHHLDADYRGPHHALVTTVGLAARLVSATLKAEACPGPQAHQARLGISDENLARLFGELEGQLVKTRDIAKVLI